MKKAATAPKPAAKKAKPPAWKPVSVATQRARHAAAVKTWKPVPVAVQRAKHAAAVKATSKKPSKAKTVRKLALGEGVACCAAEAVAASLRLAGRPVTDADVLALYRHTAGDPDAGATILATLEAAAEYGLAGVPAGSTLRPGGLSSDCELRRMSGVLLGLELPGPHAVLDDGVAWWSWGEPYDPAAWPDAVIEEAWTVTWASHLDRCEFRR